MEDPQYRRHTYPLSEDRLRVLKETSTELVEKEFMIPARTPVATPVFPVWKKDGSLRLVTDYRPLKRIAIKDDYPMPEIHDLVNRLVKRVGSLS